MKNSTSPFLLVTLASVFLLACYSASLSVLNTPTPQPTLASVPAAVPTLSITQPGSTEPLIESGGDLQNENLLVKIPPGFKIDYEDKQDNMVITEMVSENESVNDWTTLVTVQIFLGMTGTTPDKYQENMTQAWSNACANSESYPVASGDENGYPFALWQLSCPINPSTQKVEYTYMKAIQGNDSFYLAQVAFRFEPSNDEVTQWMNYLRKVIVCDTRIPEQACP
jgi:hypothetical protein